MNSSCKFLWPGLVLAALTLPAYSQAPVGRWNLGEQDPGAVAGGYVNVVTKDSLSTNDLAAYGYPSYSANVPGGGSTLSMAFDGASVVQGSIVGSGAGFDSLYRTLDFNNFSLSCDVFMMAAGAGGFSFPVSIGRNGGGLAIVEVGGNWHVIHQGVVNSAAGPAAALNAWTHLDLVRKDFGSGVRSVLFINGVGAVTNATTPISPTDFFTIGGNELGTAVPGSVEGYFNGLVDNVVITNLSLGSPPAVSGIAVAPDTIYTGNSIILAVTGLTGDSASRSFAWRKDGTVITNTTTAAVTIPGVTTTFSGNYDVVITNLHGTVTSPPVAVTVLDASYSGGADVVRYRMGDNDPGAADGMPGNAVTKDAIGTNDLVASGAPLYGSSVPVGGGSFSMTFDGASFYRSTELTNLYDNLDFNNFSLSCDVYVTALGGGGFSFPISMGGQNGGGFSIVEIGGTWYLLHQTVGQSSVGFPVTLNQWTHLELQRRQFGTAVRSRLFVNGVDVGAQITSGPTLPIQPILTVGANTLADGVGVEGPFSGRIDNVVIHNYSVGAKPVIVSGPAASPGTVLVAGDSLTLTATAQGGSPLTFNWRKNGAIIASTVGGSGLPVTTTITNVAASEAGSYDIVVTNLLGSATSSAIKVVVLPAGTQRQTPVVQFRLGEDDPGAIAGGPGAAATRSADGSLQLAANGSPIYSSLVPAGGSTLSMVFPDGLSFYEGTGDSWTALYSVFDFNNFSVACDVYMTGLGAKGFSFPFSIGGSGTGLAVVEVGGSWRLIHHSVVLGDAGPAVELNTWTHLEVLRKDFGSGTETRLVINGVDSGLSITGGLNPPVNAFFVGANRVGSGPEGQLFGQVDNVVLQSFTSPAAYQTVQMVAGQVQVDALGRANGTYTLWRTLNLNPASWSKVTTQTADAAGNVRLVDPSSPPGGAFYRTTAP